MAAPAPSEGTQPGQGASKPSLLKGLSGMFSGGSATGKPKPIQTHSQHLEREDSMPGEEAGGGGGGRARGAPQARRRQGGGAHVPTAPPLARQQCPPPPS